MNNQSSTHKILPTIETDLPLVTNEVTRAAQLKRANPKNNTKADRPLVTFALFAYNQEKYIREAMEGALSQTYEPLEIIFSDDCSTDNTFNIIENLAANYSGPHSIRLNRNPENMGISRHVRYIHEMANGEIIIHAAGDDISYPERTTVTVKTFYDQTISPSLVMSNAHVVSDGGELLGLYSKEKNQIIEINGDPTDFRSIGSAATYAITKDLVDIYPHPIPEIYGEDRVALIRAKLSDGVIYTPEILVKYRISDTGVWSSTFLLELSDKEVINRQLNRAIDYTNIMKQLLIDIDFSKRSDKKAIEEKAKFVIEEKSRVVNLVRGNIFTGLASILTELSNRTACKALFKLFVIKWIPLVRKAKRLLPKKTVLHPALQVPFER